MTSMELTAFRGGSISRRPINRKRKGQMTPEQRQELFEKLCEQNGLDPNDTEFGSETLTARMWFNLGIDAAISPGAPWPLEANKDAMEDLLLNLGIPQKYVKNTNEFLKKRIQEKATQTVEQLERDGKI